MPSSFIKSSGSYQTNYQFQQTSTQSQRYMSMLHLSISRWVMMNSFSATYDFANIEVLVRSVVDTEMSIRLAQNIESQWLSQSTASRGHWDWDQKGKSHQQGKQIDPSTPARAVNTTDYKPRGGSGLVWNNNNNNHSGEWPLDLSNTTCYRCNGKGHIANHCPTQQRVGGRAAEPVTKETINIDEELGDIGVAMVYASSTSVDNDDESNDGHSKQGVADYSNSDKSAWVEFNQEHHQVEARVAQVVPLEPEVDV